MGGGLQDEIQRGVKEASKGASKSWVYGTLPFMIKCVVKVMPPLPGHQKPSGRV